MKLKIITLLSLLLSFSAFSNEYQEEIDKFFNLYKTEKISQAVDSIYSTNKYVSSIPDQVQNVKNQLTAAKGMLGEINFINKISDYKVGDLMVQVTYIVTYDRQPLRFEFQFFKVNDGWRVYSFSFDDDLDDELKVLARKSALSNS